MKRKFSKIDHVCYYGIGLWGFVMRYLLNCVGRNKYGDEGLHFMCLLRILQESPHFS